MNFDISDIVPRVPLWLKALLIAVLCIISAAIAYNYRDAKADKDMAKFKLAIAEDGRRQAEQNFNQLITNTNAMRDLAVITKGSISKLNKDIDSLRKERKTYVKENPLPANCVPDSERMRQLEAAIDRANDSAAR